MPQAIITKYLGPTDTEGARITATCYSGSIAIDDTHHHLDGKARHLEAAQALCRKLDWTGTLIGGSLPDEAGYAFVFADES